KEYKKAERYYIQALDLAETHGQLKFQIEVAHSLAHHYIAMGRLKEAYIYANKVLELLEQGNASGTFYDANHDQLHAEHNLGIIYLQEQQIEKAGSHLLKTFNKARVSASRDLVLHMEADVAAYYAATADYKNAYQLMRHSAASRDTLLEEQKDKVLSNWM